jgi:phage shock protein C
MSKQLQLSTQDKKIAGVCGGIAEYFDIDPTLVRILWVVVTLMGGAGVFLYIIAWILMPSRSIYD